MLSLRVDSATVRLFISLEVPEKAKRVIKSRSAAIRSLRHVRWELSEKFHITLRFLGETRRELIPELCGVIESCCKRFVPLDITTDGVEALILRRYTQTLAVIAESGDAFFSLKDEIDSKLETIGFEPEKRDFIPHITIGRIRKRIKLPELPQFKLEFVSDRVCLMESELRREGAVHREVEGFRLGE